MAIATHLSAEMDHFLQLVLAQQHVLGIRYCGEVVLAQLQAQRSAVVTPAFRFCGVVLFGLTIHRKFHHNGLLLNIYHGIVVLAQLQAQRSAVVTPPAFRYPGVVLFGLTIHRKFYHNAFS